MSASEVADTMARLGFKPTILTMLQLSTAHLSPASKELLDLPPSDWRTDDLCPHVDIQMPVYEDTDGHKWFEGGGDGLVVLPYRHGWVVYVPEEHRDAEVPGDLARCFQVARVLGCDRIEFDGDNDVMGPPLWVYDEEGHQLTDAGVLEQTA